MKRVFNIFALAILALAYTACEKMPIPEHSNDSNDVIVTIPIGNYISFQADANTRAHLVTEKYISEDFGVYAYYYDFSKGWDGQRAVAQPKLMWNGTEEKKEPLKVSSSGGIYTYNASNAVADAGGQIPWRGGSKHAFLAYYPYEADAVEPCAMTTQGSPFLTYTIDCTDATKLVDVMTGHVYDITAASNQKAVTFIMQHRTAGVDVSICNAYQHTFFLDQNGVEVNPDAEDENGNKLYDEDDLNAFTEEITLEVESLKLNFSGLTYDTAKYYLEKNDDADSTTKPIYSNANNSNKTASYQIIKKLEEVGQTDGFIITNKTNTSMTFIPQSERLTVDAEIKFKKRRQNKSLLTDPVKFQVVENGKPKYDENDNPVWDYYEADENGVFTINKTSTFEQELKEGSHYYIVLTFTSAAVSINIVTAAAWDEVPVEYEFM